VLIWKGGENSKKTQEVEERLQQALDREKQVLSQRYGPEHANTPVLVEKPTSSSAKELVPCDHSASEKELTPRKSADSASRKRSPLLKPLNLDEITTIMEDKEETTARSSKGPWDSPDGGEKRPT
jgi:hypothetical protein